MYSVLFYSARCDLSSDPNVAVAAIQETDEVGDANLVPIQVEAEGLGGVQLVVPPQ